MTQFIEPNKKSDLTGVNVLSWLQSLRTGLLSGFTVSYNSGFNVDIASGKVVIRGTTIHDDLTRVNQSGLASFNANAQHVSIWVKYTYVDTFPPAAMTIGATATNHATTPTIPAIPADSVKIADIFIPAGAANLSTATIINAPPLPAQGNADGDVLVERLIASNANIAITGGGGVTLATGTLTWTAAISIVAPPITHREKFGTAALVHASIAAGSIGSVPNNSILFTHVDRRTPNTIGTAVAAVMKFIDLDAPTPAQMSDFAPASERDKIIILGRVTGGVLAMTGALGALPVPTTEPPPRFLGMDPGGAHTWDIVSDDAILGGLHVLTGVQTEADIPVAVQRVGMLVYKPGTQTLYRISSTGSPPTLAAVQIQDLNVPGVINADGGIGRSTSGALGIGNDADVTNINIGTSLNTGAVNLGRAGSTTNVDGNLAVDQGVTGNHTVSGQAGVTGNGGPGSGPGVKGTGGATNGRGAIFDGVGAGEGVLATGGPSNGHGGVFQGNGTGVGIVSTGGIGGGAGVEGAAGGSNGLGGNFLGNGSGAGVRGEGGSTGPGVQGVGGPTNGAGVQGTGGTTSGVGGSFTGTGTASGVVANGGPTNGTGVTATGFGSGNGVRAVAGANGSCLNLTSSASGKVEILDNGASERRLVRVSTTDATLTTVFTEGLFVDNAHSLFEVTFLAMRTNAPGTLAVRTMALIRRESGSAVFVSGGSNDFPTASPSSADIGVIFSRRDFAMTGYLHQITVSGANVVIKVQGAVGHDVDWTVHIHKYGAY